MDWSLSLGRFVTGALISALLAIGGVWFVVDMSLRGLESSIVTTNRRIDDLRTELISHLDLKVQNLEMKLLNEFENTRSAIRKAELPVPQQGPVKNRMAQDGGSDRSTTAAIDRSSLTEMPASDLNSEDLVGTVVYGANDMDIGEIDHVVLKPDGKVDAVIVGVGGFLGIGEKEVALGADKLTLMVDRAGNKYLYTTITKEELGAAAPYEKSTWADQREKQRMIIQ